MMYPHEKHDTHESNQSLWLLIASPTIWTGHFLASYLTAAIWCAKYAGPDQSLGNVRVAIAVLLALGIAGERLDPVVRIPDLFAPIPISLLELVVVWTWHAPGLHHLARHTVFGLLAEQSMFLICGLLLWLSAFGGNRPQDANRAAVGGVGLLLTMMHMVLLGALLALTPRTLYAHGESHTGLTSLEDQHLGGAIMLVGGGVSYLLGGLWLSFQLLRGNSTQPRVTR
jgi:putative membrane protein